MEIDVLLFGAASAAIGSGRVRVILPTPCTCRVALERLAAHDPRLRPFVADGRLAINHRFAAPEQTINAGDEIALISMVSGG